MVLLLEMLRRRLLLTLAAVCSSGLTAILTLGWNAQLSNMINIVGEGKPLSLNGIALALVTIFGISGMTYIKGYVSGFTCESLTHDLRMGYARYFSILPISEAEHLNTGEQLSKLQNEISEISGYLNYNLFQVLDDGVRFITTIVWLFILNARLTLAVNLPVLVILAYVFYSSKVIGNATERSQQAKGRMNKHAGTLLALFPIIRLYDATRMMLGNYCKEVNEWEQQTVRAEQVRARLMSLSGLFSNIPLMLLFLVGGGMTINGTLTIGTLYLFFNLSGNVTGVLMNMPGFIAAFRQFLANMKRLSSKIVPDGRGGWTWGS